MSTDKLRDGLRMIGEGFITLSAALDVVKSEPVSEPVKEEKAAPKTKAKPKAPKKSKAAPEQEEFDFEENDFDGLDEEQTEEDAPAVTEIELRNALLELARAHGKEKAYACLEKFGAKKVNELDESDYGKVHAYILKQM